MDPNNPPVFYSKQIVYEADHHRSPAVIKETHYIQEPAQIVYTVPIQEHHHPYNGCKIPVLSKTCAIIILIINIFIPGWGTMILGCYSDHHMGYFILKGLLQFLLAGLIVGWVWSIITGVKVVKRSQSQI
jgi:hypothetical protein